MSSAASVPPRVKKVIELGRVERSLTPCHTIPFSEAVRQYCSRKLSLQTGSAPGIELEACSEREGQFLADVRQNPFIEAVHVAFARHHPLVLSPHAIWLLVAQGLATHINANSESLRPQVVGHQGKLELSVRRDDFVRGSPDNPWPEAFDAFAIQIQEHLRPGLYDLIVPRYSMTTADDVAVTQIVLIDAVKSYFSYLLRTMCGIPQIHLEGTAGDWEKLLHDVRALDQFELKWWTAELVPVLEQFVAAANDDVDLDFWGSLYKYRSESGGPYVNGWINVFFPYLNPQSPEEMHLLERRIPRPETKPATPIARRRAFKDSAQLPDAERMRAAGSAGGNIAARYRALRTPHDEFPTGLSVAPFKWDYLGTMLDMRFVGGFVGVRQEPDTLALRPETGWVVVPS